MIEYLFDISVKHWNEVSLAVKAVYVIGSSSVVAVSLGAYLNNKSKNGKDKTLKDNSTPVIDYKGRAAFWGCPERDSGSVRRASPAQYYHTK